MVLAEPDSLLALAVRSLILLSALVAFTVGFRRWRRDAVEGTDRLLARQAESLESLAQLHATQARQAVQLQTRLELLEQQVEARIERLQQRLDSRLQTAGAVASAVPRGYELALRLARTGTCEEEIADASGLSRAEAQLLVRLHGPRQSA
ncbi:MAG: hypothetical protein RLZZ200_866 [Pseudomonadota bacterium]|jgi:response regulator RpfG family c-di-GMP phosphodiesterase